MGPIGRLAGWILAAVMAIACASAPASEGGAKRARKAKSHAESPALDNRVAEAATIFVGEGVRIYFVDRQFREVPYIRAVGDGDNRSALVVVKVVKVLYPPDAAALERVLVPIETSRDVLGEGRSRYDEQIERHVGKQEIWFGQIVVRHDYGDDRSGRKPLEDPVTLLQAGSASAKSRSAAVSMPIRQLKAVTDSIARVKAMKAAAGPEK